MVHYKNKYTDEIAKLRQYKRTIRQKRKEQEDLKTGPLLEESQKATSQR